MKTCAGHIIITNKPVSYYIVGVTVENYNVLQYKVDTVHFELCMVGSCLRERARALGHLPSLKSSPPPTDSFGAKYKKFVFVHVHLSGM